MRRQLTALAVTGLALATFGCSSSDDNATTSSTTAPSTTSSVVVSAANKPTCDAFATLATAIKAPIATDESDPVKNATAIQAFLVTLVAPLEAVKAVAPAEVKTSIDVLMVNGQAAADLDPTDPAAQSELGKMLLAPSAEVAAANKAIGEWAATNCGISLVR